MKLYSTREAAKAAGISLITLQRWIAKRKIKPPKIQVFGGVRVRLWSREDIQRIKEIRKK